MSMFSDAMQQAFARSISPDAKAEAEFTSVFVANARQALYVQQGENIAAVAAMKKAAIADGSDVEVVAAYAKLFANIAR